MKQLIIFDTTLRDGEQSPGASMTHDEKLMLAKQLERLGVDVIEAGFPAASPGDFEAVSDIARNIQHSTVCGLARATQNDIEKAGEAIGHAKQGRIHTFIATSPLHMAEKLRLAPEQVIERAVAAIRLARRYTDDVEFSAEDGGRSEIDFLCRVVEAAIEAGATTINIPDTVGYNMPHEYASRLKMVIERVPNAGKAVFSTHCHNDLGLAVANSLAGVLAGARQVECTINGLGERAGNAALEEIVMAVKTRKDIFSLETNIQTEELLATSRLVATITGFPVQPNKAIVGANAFAHESGIHQDGVLKHRETYEIMRPEEVGWGKTKLVLGKLSGRNAFKERLKELGIAVADEEKLNASFARFKVLADKKQEIFDEDLYAIVNEEELEAGEKIQLLALEVSSGAGNRARARLTLSLHGVEKSTEAEGVGPVDAVFKGIETVCQSGAKLALFSVNNITAGTDSQGEVTVRLQKDGKIVNGLGSDMDIVAASAKAYVNALNRLYFLSEKIHPQL